MSARAERPDDHDARHPPENITVGYRRPEQRSKFIRDITLNLSAENLHIWKSTTASTPTSRPTAALALRASIWAHTPPRTIVFSIQLRY
ncbi:MAG: hypothetical protein ACLRMJ_03710 [Alistipes finegoldii]